MAEKLLGTMSNIIAYWNFQERKLPHICVHILPQVSIPLSRATYLCNEILKEHFLVLSQIDVHFLLQLCEDIASCCVVYCMLIDNKSTTLVLFRKLVCGTQNSQKEVVSNLYWEALFSGKLHQHIEKNPNGMSRTVTCNYWCGFQPKATSTGCLTVL